MSKTGIRFHPSVKKHDGLCNDSKLLQSLIFNFFGNKNLNSKADILKFLHEEMNKLGMLHLQGLTNLKTSLCNLIETLNDIDKNASIPILKGGGGKNGSLGKAHNVHLKYIYESLS